ncbi:MAG: hypothetical protein IPK60_04190 [Sandaracinaceae bacterium]|nr:hypothetical protein [Sandaracinaceae bacterium]
MNSLLRPSRLVLICLALATGACGSPSGPTITDDAGGPPTDGGMLRPDSGNDANIQPMEPAIIVDPASGLMTTELGGTATFTVRLNTEPTADVVIALTSLDETEGTISVSSLTFTQANYASPQTVTITGVDDSTRDDDQAYSIDLAPASSTDDHYNGLSADDVSVINIDDESAGVTVTPIEGLVTNEDGLTAMFTVVLNSAPSSDVQIGLASANSAEGTAAPMMLTFTATNWDAPQTVTVTGADDFVQDGPVAYQVHLADPVSEDADYDAVTGLPSVTLTNNDNDTAGVTVTPTSGISTTEIGGTATFTVVLNTLPAGDVTIALSSDDEGEGTVTPATITFTAEDWDAPQVVTVTGVDDELADGSVLFHVITSNAASSDAAYEGFDVPDVALTNTDNDTAGLILSRLSGVRTSESGLTDTFTVALNSMPSGDVSVSVTSLDLTEGTVSPETLTFTPLNWNAPQTVTVTGVDDAIADGLQTYNVRVVPVAGGDAAYTAALVRNVAVQNTDNDSPGITISAGPLSTSEAGDNDTVTVVLNTAPTTDVFILITIDDATEASLSTSVLRFTTANWETPQTIRVNGVDDTANDGDQTFNVGIGPTSSADPNYDVPDPVMITGTNVDDEQPGLTVTRAAVTNTDERGGSFTFTVRLNTIPRGGVNVGITTPDGDEVSISPSSLHFEPDGTNAWNVNQTVTVRGLADGFVDGDQPFTVRTAVTTSEDPDYTAIAGTVGAVTFGGVNIDYDLNRILVSPTSGLTTSEDGRTAEFFLAASGAPRADVTVTCASTNEAEGHVTNSPIVITAANWGTPRGVIVQGMDDVSEDGDVPYTVVCSNAVSSDSTYNNVPTGSVSLQNLDNEVGSTTPGLEIFPTDNLITSERGHEAQVTFALTAEPRGRVLIPVSVERRSTEGRLLVDSISFDARNWQIPQVLRIIGLDDTERDGNQRYTVIIDSIESEDPAYNKLDPDDLSVTNYDDEAGSAGIEVNPLEGLHTSEWGNIAALTVVLSAPPEGRVGMLAQLDNEREARLLNDTVSFDTDNWFIPQVVSVQGLDDGDEDGDVGYHVTFKLTDVEDGNYAALEPPTVSVVNWDDERGTPGIVISDSTNLRITEAGREASFTVSLRSRPRDRVHVSFSSDRDDACKLTVDALDFDPDNWNVPQAVTFLGMDVTDTEGDTFLHIIGTAERSDDEQYLALAPVYVNVVNEDDDMREFYVVTEREEPATLSEGDSTRFTIYLSNQPEADVCVRVLSDDWTESYTDVAWACFTPDNWSEGQRVTLYGIADSEDDREVFSHIVIGPAFSDDTNWNLRTGAAPWVNTVSR